MKIDVQCVRRPKLPRYFPPGYFDRWFWLMAALNTFTPAWCAGWAYYAARDGNTLGLAVQCVILAGSLWSFARCAQRVRQHSHKWRTVDRARHEALIVEMEAHAEAMARDFAEYMNSRGQNEERQNRVSVVSDRSGAPRR